MSPALISSGLAGSAAALAVAGSPLWSVGLAGAWTALAVAVHRLIR